jgi:DNA-3-methyladenine glycosylase I
VTEALIRCPWCDKFDQYRRYHDEEWGVPVKDDKVHFEFMTLESAQAGLSWDTVLKKREGYRAAFADFAVAKVAAFTEADCEHILSTGNVVRNRLKVFAAVSNARLFLDVQKEYGSYSAFIWSFVGHKPVQNQYRERGEVPATTAQSDALSVALKKRGFKFVGSTICYAHMQATGLFNDHLLGCHRYQEVKALGAQFSI